jgi:hypothetical protein
MHEQPRQHSADYWRNQLGFLSLLKHATEMSEEHGKAPEVSLDLRIRWRLEQGGVSLAAMLPLKRKRPPHSVETHRSLQIKKRHQIDQQVLEKTGTPQGRPQTAQARALIHTAIIFI